METDNPQAAKCIFDKAPDAVVPEITESECENLQAFSGLDGRQNEDCTDLSKLICDIKQEVDAINIKEVITIFANDASKCADDDLPTLASIFSRILRYVQAATCVLCAYDPRLASVLQTGKFPEILMGSASSASSYPQWVKADDYPLESSIKPVSSAGVYQAVQDAILAVWHLWEEQPEFDYFAQTLNDPNDLHNLETQGPFTEGNTALIATDGGKTSLLYKYVGGEWVYQKQFTATDKLVNFAVTHINYGYYATNGVYYFDGTWQVMDADFGVIDNRVSRLEQIYERAVLSEAGKPPLLITTASSLEEASTMPCDPNRDMVVLITG